MAKLKRKRQNTGIYVLLAGQHHDESGRIYNKGDVVVDHQNDLIAMFGDNKFREGDERDLEDMEEEVETPPVPESMRGLKTVPKAKKADKEAEAAKTTASDEDNEQGDEDEGDSEPEEESPDFGTDVTKVFPGARKAKVKVFKKGKQYTVVDKDAPNSALNSDELHTPNQVNKYLESL